MNDQGEFKGTYGASQTPCRVFYVGRWYAIEGSVNVNHAPYPFKVGMESTYNVEVIQDTDKSTAGEPINSVEDLLNHLNI